MSRWVQRIARRLRGEAGFTLIELVTSMTILMVVMGAVTGVLVSGTNAQIDANNRFQAQTQARLALDTFRREVHCASGSTTASPAASVTLTLPVTCPTAAGSTNVTWCTVANGTGRYGLWRYSGAACSGTGRKVADYLTTQNAFTYVPPAGSTAAGTGELGLLQIVLNVNLTPSKPERVYSLQDRVILRNGSRPA